MTTYITNVKIPSERVSLIEQAKESTGVKHTLYEYQNRRSELPVVRLDISVPIYRMENFRTRTMQIKYIHERELRNDFFSSGQENESSQRAQHDILVAYATRGRSSSVTPIMDHLRGEEQREPLLVTSEGVVVNGNRRLAAMRELFVQDPTRFGHFGYVDCAVLPSSITPNEIVELEVRLQMRPETKLPYGWIEESMAIKEMLNKGMQTSHVADLIKKKPKEILTAERALTEVDIYLKEWLNDPENYQKVEDAAQFFGDLAKALVDVEGSMLEVKRRIAWTLLENTDSLPGRIYNYEFSFDKKTDEVIAELSQRLPIEQNATPVVDRVENFDDSIEIDLDESEDQTPEQRLVAAFDDPLQRERVSEELVDVCVAIHEQTRQLRVGNLALSAIKTANTKLKSVDLSKAEPNTYKDIEKQLVIAKLRIATLEESLVKYIDKAPLK